MFTLLHKQNESPAFKLCSKLNRWIFIAIVFFTLAGFILVHSIPYEIPTDATFLKYTPIILILLYIYIVASYVKRNERLCLTVETFFLLLLGSFCLVLWTYWAVHIQLPLINHQLDAGDRALGFDWQIYAPFFIRSHWTARPLSLCYYSYDFLAAAGAVGIYWCRNVLHGQRTLIAYIIAGMATITVAALYPAVPANITAQIDMQNLKDYVCIHTNMTFAAGETIARIQKHSLPYLPWPSDIALITFPSFHAVIAVLFIYLAWPIRILRVVFLIVCAGMLFSTPWCGFHYISDVLAGIIIALISILFSHGIVQRCLHAHGFKNAKEWHIAFKQDAKSV